MIQFVLETDRALFEDAMRFAQQQVRKLVETHPGFYPMYTADGKWKILSGDDVDLSPLEPGSGARQRWRCRGQR
jgi:hypothetical protein